MSEPLNRWRVGFLSVHGVGWWDFASYREALAWAKKAIRDGCRDVHIMREYESANRYAADFRRVWP